MWAIAANRQIAEDRTRLQSWGILHLQKNHHRHPNRYHTECSHVSSSLQRKESTTSTPYLWPSLHLCMYKDTAVHFSDPTLICQRIYEILDLLLVLLYRLRSLCPKTYCTPAKTFLAWVYTKCPGKGDYLQLPGNTSRPTLLLVFLLLGGSLGLPSTSCGLICIDRRNSWKGWARISQGCAVILRILET